MTHFSMWKRKRYCHSRSKRTVTSVRVDSTSIQCSVREIRKVPAIEKAGVEKAVFRPTKLIFPRKIGTKNPGAANSGPSLEMGIFFEPNSQQLLWKMPAQNSKETRQ